MHKRRDRKGRFVTSKIQENSRKPPKITEKSRKTPHTNSANVCVGKILRGEISKEVIGTTTNGTKSEATIQIENIVHQARREALASQSERRDGKETKVVVEEVASTVGETHKVLEQFYIPTNPMLEPSLSGETSPTPYNMLFGDLADEEGNANNET
jgi:hypothetical protein